MFLPDVKYVAAISISEDDCLRAIDALIGWYASCSPTPFIYQRFSTGMILSSAVTVRPSVNELRLQHVSQFCLSTMEYPGIY